MANSLISKNCNLYSKKGNAKVLIFVLAGALLFSLGFISAGYSEGDTLEYDGYVYECKVAGWCDQDAYHPRDEIGAGYWKEAWNKVGPIGEGETEEESEEIPEPESEEETPKESEEETSKESEEKTPTGEVSEDEQTDTLISAELKKPGKPSISWMPPQYNAPASYNIKWNMWWGENGNVWKLYENGGEIFSENIEKNSPNSQKANYSISGEGEGEYNYKVVLCDSVSGAEECSESSVVEIRVGEQKEIFIEEEKIEDVEEIIEKDIISGKVVADDELTEEEVIENEKIDETNNREREVEEVLDEEGEIPSKPKILWMAETTEETRLIVKWGLSGEGGTYWKLYENGGIAFDGILEISSGQNGYAILDDKDYGQYNFIVEVCNLNGCERSDLTTVYVVKDKGMFDRLTDGIIKWFVDSGEDVGENLVLDIVEEEVVPVVVGDEKVVVYFPEWGIYGRNFQPADISYDKITNVLYAFAKIGSDGSMEIWDSYAALDKAFPGDCWNEGCKRGLFNQFAKYKELYPHINLAMSVGGWSGSGEFHSLKDEGKREKFVQSSVDFLREHEMFDGIDIDWEFPNNAGAGNSFGAEDGETYIVLMKDLREAFDLLGEEKGRHYELTTAIGSANNLLGQVDYSRAHQYLDSIYTMTYDFHGAWSKVTGHNSPLYNNNDPVASTHNSDSAVSYLISEGVPSKKIVMGASMYGRSWSGVVDKNNPLYSMSSGAGPKTWEAGVLDFKDIDENYLGKNGYEYVFDEVAVAAYLFNGDNFISYDSPDAIEAKSSYVLEKDLGGIMFWEISSDNGKILDAVQGVFGGGVYES